MDDLPVWRKHTKFAIIFSSIFPLLSSQMFAVPGPNFYRSNFDCRRFTLYHCCANRIRNNCPSLCTQSPSQSFCMNPQTVPTAGSNVPAGLSAANSKPPFTNGFEPPQPPLSVGQNGWMQPLPPQIMTGQQFGNRRRITTEGGTETTPSSRNTGESPISALGQWEENGDEEPSSAVAAAASRSSIIPDLPSPPVGIVLPPPETPLALGTPFPTSNSEEKRSAIATTDGKMETMIEVSPSLAGASEISSRQDGTASELTFPTLIPQVLMLTTTTTSPTGERETNLPPSKQNGNGAVDGVAVPSNRFAARTDRVIRPPTTQFGGTDPVEEMAAKSEGDGGIIRTMSNNGGSQIGQAFVSNTGVEKSIAAPAPWQPFYFQARKVGDISDSIDSIQSRTTVSEQIPFVPPSPSSTSSLAGISAPATASQPWMSFWVRPSAAGNGNATLQNPPPTITQSRMDLPLPTDNLMGRISNKTAGIPVGEKIDVLIDQVFNKNLIGALSAYSTHLKKNQSSNNRSFVSSSTQSIRQTVGQFTLTATTMSTILSSHVCGTAPDFIPCVPLEQANAKFLERCQQKGLPPGCLPLCRYDTTQAQIKTAFDRAQCGILHIVPFLECASNGGNNLDCCRHKQVAQRTAPQCEVFCNPAGGIGVGLQHLVCQSAIQDFLQCHHSGLKL